MAEFQIGDHTYRSGKMSPMTQFNVMKRMLPVFSSFKEIKNIQELRTASTPEERLPAMMALLDPLLSQISKISDEDTQYIFNACLSICDRCDGKPEPGKAWFSVWNVPAKRPMYDDIDVPTMMQVAYHVMMEVFSGFFTTPLQSSFAEALGR